MAVIVIQKEEPKSYLRTIASELVSLMVAQPETTTTSKMHKPQQATLDLRDEEISQFSSVQIGGPRVTSLRWERLVRLLDPQTQTFPRQSF